MKVRACPMRLANFLPRACIASSCVPSSCWRSRAARAPAARYLQTASRSPAASHWEVAGGGFEAGGAVRGRSRGSNSCPTSLDPALSRELLTRVAAHSVTTGTSKRVAERAGGRGSTARATRVAAAAVAAVAAVAGARARAARAVSGSGLGPRGWWRLVVARLRAVGGPPGRWGGVRRVGPGQAVAHGHARAGAGRRDGPLPPLQSLRNRLGCRYTFWGRKRVTMYGR